VEALMPHRRTDKKGSFGGHFDDLVKVVGTEPHVKAGKAKRRPKTPEKSANIHDRLFEGAWKAQGKTSF
jgi:hypothetical protein